MEKQPPIITAQTIDEYMKSVGASESCPYCKCTDWALNGDDGDEATYVNFWELLRTQAPFRTGVGLQVIPMTCVQCGNMRATALAPILRWLEGKEK